MHRTMGVVTNYKEVGLQSGKGGGKFYPPKKGDRQHFSHAEGGGGGQNKFWGSFSLEALAIPFKRRGGVALYCIRS